MLYFKATSFGGLYDTSAPGGGDVRIVKASCITLNPYILGRYVIRAPFGSEGFSFPLPCGVGFSFTTAALADALELQVHPPFLAFQATSSRTLASI